jgi:hypothetical protein
VVCCHLGNQKCPHEGYNDLPGKKPLPTGEKSPFKKTGENPLYEKRIFPVFALP